MAGSFDDDDDDDDGVEHVPNSLYHRATDTWWDFEMKSTNLFYFISQATV